GYSFKNKDKSELISQLHLARYRAHVLDIEIAEIKRSISWKITNRFNNSVIERALPHESKRRRWYDLGLKAMRILANDGLSTLLQEYRSRNAYYCSIAHKESENPENTFHETVMDDFLIQLHSFHRNWGIALEVKRHYEKNVNIVICIHNALDDVKSCLMSVIKYSPHIYTLILVDDGSDEATKSFLQDFALHHDVFLLRNDVARGYTFAANQGLRNSTGKYVILLNSDTIVSADWLDRMLECAESDERIGIVGPLSNTASWQSVPKIESCGDWASNDLPENISIHMMADLIGKYSCRCYPKIPFLNGFCLLIKRELINQIGYFDEDSFGAGYGEENDYCIRARKAQWDLAVADDVYIYHKQSRSYSDDRRKKLCDRAGKILIDKHGIQEVSEGVSECKGNRAMAGIRARADVLWHRHGLLEEGKKLFKGKSLLIILPIMEPTGGAYVIIQEAYALIEMGVRVSLFNLTEHGVKFQQSFPDLRIPVIYGSINEVPLIAADFDAVIATINNSVYWIASLNSSDITLAYYIQDFEPDFYPKGSREYNLAWESYMKIPRIKNVTKTSWNKNKVMSNMGIDCQIIGPSVDIDLFRPRERLHKSNDIFIGAMIRPSTPRRNPRFTLEILEEIKKLYGDKINIITFGCSNDDFLSLNPCRDIPINHMGVLKREWMPHLFNEIDIFVDFSTYQAMGLTALEAMACGSAVIVPRNGGCQDFVKDGINGFLIDTTDRRSCTDALEKLINDEKLRKKMCSQSIIDVCRFPAELAALNMLKAIFI
uniref:glycosyltransferase n=1 Tax=Methanosaeta sp. UBA458 TaxID=1915561 RepID=UPI00257C3745